MTDLELNISDDFRQRIADLTYVEMLRLWRFEPVGSTLFQGDNGTYFQQIMKEKRSAVSCEMHAKISKTIGF